MRYSESVIQEFVVSNCEPYAVLIVFGGPDGALFLFLHYLFIWWDGQLFSELDGVGAVGPTRHTLCQLADVISVTIFFIFLDPFCG